MTLNRKYRRHQFSCLALVGLIVVILSCIPLRMAIAKQIAPAPQAILTLGGDIDREIFTARFAQMHPSLDIWISSGANLEATRRAFQQIAPTRVHIDRRAIDTVTNFTSLVADFKQHKFHHIYVVTADYHMRRAKAIATFVLGSQGIAFTPVAMPTNKPVESRLHLLRDVCRALLWVLTRRTGASLHPSI
ncbi:YdcF family protein [Aliterella atlantica]|uniref:YdcF family protein n=1 Tax=Aliterella atlantica TaxID=1827278 RepID=UPI0005D45E93|nr:YdcF family protein [Aliterella atlantica]